MTRNSKIAKVLIANRGEIAFRIQRTCVQLGVQTVSVASEADKEALFARKAEKLVVIGPAAPKDSYLNGNKLIEVALREGCNAVHPGYGFLSENAEFAQAVVDAGLIFIGPTPDTIRRLGSKTEAKAIALKAKVPCAPFSEGGLTDNQLLHVAPKLGFPVLIKAVSGGGGRGMRMAKDLKELAEALPRARAEAEKFFKDENVYLERYVERPRHVEVQIFGDSHGNVVHLGTRDCSTQRRHQKIIEEAPAPCLSPKVRKLLHDSAVKIGKAVGYRNAGTVEFLVKDEEIFFLEVNTRIQVEHPATEMITGLDLIELQIRIAEGKKLPFSQREVKFRGHAIEFRLCAEDPWKGFAPSRGTITTLKVPPQSKFHRFDTGVEEGDEVTLHYDSMLGKIVVWDENRSLCIDKSIDILRHYELEGLFCILALSRLVLYNHWFRRAPLDIGYIERELSDNSLSELRACEAKDPLWGIGLFGSSSAGTVEETMTIKNCYEYKSEKYKTTYTIEILHKRDGFFVAVPVDATGRRANNSSCRMSNGLNTVMKSLINDVLEQTPPSEIFS